MLLLTDSHPLLEAFQSSQALTSQMVCSPSPKHHQEIIEGLDRTSLLVKHRVFVEELAVLNVKHQLIDEQVVAIQEGIVHIDKVNELDED